ncbi:MAG: cupin domain-containing protein [Deltaproteobacteria bacterium]|nr:cupin domain-containing protein [Deltaproteobacteria bacterium]
MSVKLVKGDSMEFGTYGFEHINLPAGRPAYWDTIQVAKIVDSKTFSEPRFGITLEKSPAGPPINHRFDYDEVGYILSGGPLRVTCEGETYEAHPGDFIIFTKGTEIVGEAVNAFDYLTIHYPPLDILIKDREKRFGLKK